MPFSSAVRAIDITGVIPDPPANSRKSASMSFGVKMPLGGRTRSVSPALRFSTIQFEA